MQDPNADTQWNDALRAKGILPPKEKDALTEADVVKMVEETVQQKSQLGKIIAELSLDELDELEDEEEERILLEYRHKRILEMKQTALKARYGELREITAVDYVDEVNKAGSGVYVILHLYKQGIPLCALINQYLVTLATKFPAAKFLKSISTTCIPNFPDKNLPTIFVYCEGEMKQQFIGPLAFRGMNLKIDELEWMLAEAGAVKTELEEDPRPKIRDFMLDSLRPSKNGLQDKDPDDDDW